MKKIKKAYVTKTIKRSDFKKATYNPRFISESSKGNLQTGLEKYGLLQPLIVNGRTGNLAGGHQRIDIIDADSGYDENSPSLNDYDIEVAVIDVDLRTEKEINVFLNNGGAMGDWDIPALQDLVISEGFELGELGFSEFDRDVIFGESGIFSDTEAAAQAKDTLSLIKEERKDADRKFVDDNAADFYAVVVFPNGTERKKFMSLIGAPEWETYADGARALVTLQQKGLHGLE